MVPVIHQGLLFVNITTGCGIPALIMVNVVIVQEKMRNQLLVFGAANVTKK